MYNKNELSLTENDAMEDICYWLVTTLLFINNISKAIAIVIVREGEV